MDKSHEKFDVALKKKRKLGIHLLFLKEIPSILDSIKCIAEEMLKNII